MFKKANSLFVIMIVSAMVLGACSQQTQVAPTVTTAPTKVQQATATSTVAPTAEQQPTATVESPAVVLPVVNPADYSGQFIAAGSSTVFPLLERLANRFEEEGYAGNYTIDSIGSGAGFERFCKTGETDISTASRKIKDAEVANCTAINRTPIEFRIGTDAIAIVVSKDNTFLTNVTKEELAKIYSSDAVKWSDVNPAWPNEDIRRFSPGTDSGTFDFFVEFVMTPAYGKDNAKNTLLNAVNTQFSEDDNVLVQGVEGSPYAIGYFGFAYYAENADRLNLVSIDGVTPSYDTAESGAYALSRPLFIYSDASIMKANPDVAAFINFVLTNVDAEIQSVGYFPASNQALDVSRQAWLDAMK
jgi:phosphate transport system substrate-binding protein